MSEPPPWAKHPDLVAFYSEHRNRPENLYPSERRFLPWLARKARSVLDTGCAAGGFRHVWCYYQPSIVYTGLDVSASLIEAARRLYPGVSFMCGNVTEGVDLPDNYANVVQALGWLNWEPKYSAAIAELWRLTDCFLFLDIRLVADQESAVIGRQKLALFGEWDGKTTTPYVTVAWPHFASMLVGLKPITLLGYGYWGKPSETVMGINHEVCFATFVLEKAPRGRAEGLPRVCVDLPLTWPPALAPQVELLPPSQLEILAPQQ